MADWLQGLSWQACANLMENSLWPDLVRTHGINPSRWPQDVQQMKQDVLTKLSSFDASSDNIFSLKQRFEKLEGLRLKGMLTGEEVTQAKSRLIPSTTSNANGAAPANRTTQVATAELPVVRTQPSAPAATATVARAPPAAARTPQTPPVTVPSNRRRVASPPKPAPKRRQAPLPAKIQPKQKTTAPTCHRNLHSSLPHSQVAECQTNSFVGSQPSHAAAEPQTAHNVDYLQDARGNVPASRQLLVTHIPLEEPHYKSIKAALKDARDGDTINIAPGSYCESMLLVQKAITLQCQSDGRVIVSSIKATSLIISAPDVTIKGIIFKATQLKEDDVAAVIVRADRTKIESCTVHAAARHAYTTTKQLPPICCVCVDAIPCKDVSILDCKIEAGQACIGVLFNSSTSGVVSNSYIYGQDGVIGVQMFSQSEVKLTNNRISNFHDDGINTVTTAKNLVITSTTITRCKWGVCAKAEQLVVTGNTITACNEGLVLNGPRPKSRRSLSSVGLHEHKVERNCVRFSRMSGIRVTSPFIRGQYRHNTIIGNAQVGLWCTLNEEEGDGVVDVPSTICLSIIGNTLKDNGDVGLVVEEPFRVDAQQCQQQNTFSGNKLGNLSIAGQ